MLTHSSGLPWYNNLKNSPDDTSALRQSFQNLKTLRLNFTPGEKFGGETYSNAGYDLLGYLIHRVSGMPFETYVRRNILQLADMPYSTYNYREIDSSRLALPHITQGKSKAIYKWNHGGSDSGKNPFLTGKPVKVKVYNIYGEEAQHNPSGNLNSNAADLSNWIIHNLRIYNDSLGNSKNFLTKKTLDKMWTTARDIRGLKTSIGLGWWIFGDDKLGKYVFHTGNIPGFSSTVIIFPEQNFGITVLSNGMYGQNAVWNEIPFEIAQLFLSGKKE